MSWTRLVFLKVSTLTIKYAWNFVGAQVHSRRFQNLYANIFLYGNDYSTFRWRPLATRLISFVLSVPHRAGRFDRGRAGISARFKMVNKISQIQKQRGNTGEASLFGSKLCYSSVLGFDIHSILQCWDFGNLYIEQIKENGEPKGDPSSWSWLHAPSRGKHADICFIVLVHNIY